jgi:protein-S-isoprenylcysteine O-methyltransferase Ste14
VKLDSQSHENGEKQVKENHIYNWVRQIAAQGGVLLFLVIALEFVIMISPFAAFFYSVFNPVFKFLEGHAATKWLTDFFLPHMILPPTGFLQAVRVLGSVLLVTGTLMFVICAVQVYLGKILRWGAADKGFYRFLRHPQYTGLVVLGLGMAILWPRFIVLAMLGIMLILYYNLARNEEERMRIRFGGSYDTYMERTGMFAPRWLEKLFSPAQKLMPGGVPGAVLGSVAVFVLLLGGGFVLRAITLDSLPMDARNNVTLVSILPEDQDMLDSTLQGVLAYEKDDGNQLFLPDRSYLGYVMPADYIMQGMIADTGSDSQLHKQHQTPTLIADWIFHPFAHLRRPPSAYMAKMYGVDPAVARRHHCPVGINDPSLECDSCPHRRVIFIEVSDENLSQITGQNCLSITTQRKPICYMDIDTRTGAIDSIQPVGTGTAWKDVPTPVI